MNESQVLERQFNNSDCTRSVLLKIFVSGKYSGRMSTGYCRKTILYMTMSYILVFWTALVEMENRSRRYM